MEDLEALGGVLKQLFRGFHKEENALGGYASNSSYNYHGTNSRNAITLRNDHGGGTNSGSSIVPFETWGDETRRKRNKAPSSEVSGEGLPIYLASLISTLLLTRSENGNSSSPASTVYYESARDVYLDLKVMLDNKNEFYRQTELDEGMMSSRLRMRNLFYGRQVQMSMLMHLFQSVVMMGNQPAIATVSGS